MLSKSKRERGLDGGGGMHIYIYTFFKLSTRNTNMGTKAGRRTEKTATEKLVAPRAAATGESRSSAPALRARIAKTLPALVTRMAHREVNSTASVAAPMRRRSRPGEAAAAAAMGTEP
jgi:hypothetical protein